MDADVFKKRLTEMDGLLKEKHQGGVDEIDGNNKLNQNDNFKSCAEDMSKKYGDKQFSRRKGGSRRKRRKLTVDKVRVEAEKILEEFLQSQLQKQSIQTSSPEKHYERYVEVDITEGTTPSGSSNGYLASNSNILREDSIPFADASEEELRKAESLPHDEFVSSLNDDVRYAESQGLEIIHGKSKSAPYSHVHEIDRHFDTKHWKYIPPPPAPPGTPHSPSEEGSSGKSATVPYVGLFTGSSSIPCSTDSLDMRLRKSHGQVTPPKAGSDVKVPSTLNLPEASKSPSPRSQKSSSLTLSDNRSSSPQKSYPFIQSLKRSGSHSSLDSSNDEGHPNLRDRKKKTVFKKAQERLSLMLRLNKAKSAPDEPYDDQYSERQTKPKVKKSKKLKKKDKKKKNAGKWIDESDVLEERHTHIDKHINQSRNQWGGGNVVRTEDTRASMEVVTDDETRYMETNVRVKQSSDSGSGFLGKLRRITRFNKPSSKSAMKESWSEHFDRHGDAASHPDYSRGMSVPGGYALSSVETNHQEDGHVKTVEVTRDNLSRHSSHIDIVDHQGSMLDRLYFEGDSLPGDRPFTYHETTDIRERHLVDGDKVKVVRDVSTHDEYVEHNLETDGLELGKDETEELYNRVAGRLAEIGDNWITEKEIEQSQRLSSPRVSIKTGEEPSSNLESDIKKEELSVLEAEIRDELRLVADKVDARLAANARQAAIQIAGIATYQKFKDVVSESVGNEVGWAQVAAVFQITKRAMKLAGGSGALAMQIRDNSLRYVSDKFAQWIVDQGGWDSLVSDGSSSSSETELD